uniref:SFRICE_030543 n=1 Tax=Spodoptera frugiperda TaxID=7108 RepID=A0A2H1VWX1_SPOFR
MNTIVVRQTLNPASPETLASSAGVVRPTSSPSKAGVLSTSVVVSSDVICTNKNTSQGYGGPIPPFPIFPNTNPYIPYPQEAGNAFVTPLVFQVSMGGGDCLPSGSDFSLDFIRYDKRKVIFLENVRCSTFAFGRPTRPHDPTLRRSELHSAPRGHARTSRPPPATQAPPTS